MGNKQGGREEDAEETAEVVVFFVSTLMDSILSSMKAELLRNFNIRLEKYTPGTTGPVLDIRDATSDDMEKLKEQSRSLEANRLLVVLVPKSKTAESSERLVVLKKSVEYSKQQPAVSTILQFMRTTRASSYDDELPQPPSSSTTPNGQRVYVALGQEKQEELLKKAVQFLQDNITDRKLELVTPDTTVASSSAPSPLDMLSPLIVICKSDGNFLKSDVRDAVKMTRSGSDVMLLVVTDKKDLKLDGVPGEEMGAKDRLYWNHSREAYTEKENKKALQWVKSFLNRFAMETYTMKRKGFIRESLNSLGKTTVSGSYHSVSSIKDDLEKNIVFFLKDHKIQLTKTTNPRATKPLVLLTTSEPAAKEEVDQLLKTHTDPESVLQVQVILQNPVHPQQTEQDSSGVTDTVTLLRTDTSRPIQPDLAENKKAAKQIKQTLVHLNARGKSPADGACSSEQLKSDSAYLSELPRPSTADTLQSSEGGGGSLGSSTVSAEGHPDQARSQRRRPQRP